LAVAGREQGAYLLQLPDLSERCRYTGLVVSTVAFSPTAGIVAAGGEKGEVALLDARSCRVLATELWHNSAVQSLAFDPTGELIVSGGENGRLLIGPPITDLITIEGGAELTGRATGAIKALAFNPDGKAFASADANGVITLWGIAE
jgi:WD40 repeat protein